VFALVVGHRAGIADRGIQPGGQEAFPVVGVEQQPALAADGADLPAGADPLAGLFLAVVNWAGRRPDPAAVARENHGGGGVPAAKLADGLRGLPPVGIDDELLATGARAVFPRPLSAEEHIDQRRQSRRQRRLEAARVNVGEGTLRAGGGEVVAGLLGVGAVGQEVAAVAAAPRCHRPEEQPLLDVDRRRQCRVCVGHDPAAERDRTLGKLLPVEPRGWATRRARGTQGCRRGCPRR
jgi:hypothetical protein